MPKVTVLLPVYNAEKYIADSIASILNQSYTDFEFIILNDGSTDGSLEIVKSFKDPRIKIVVKQNTGLIDTLNYGIKISQGGLIARMDADDVALPNRFELQVNRFGHDVAVLGGQFSILTEKNEKIKANKLPLNHKDILSNLLNGKPSIVHPCAIINKALLVKASNYDEKMIMAEDLDLWLRLSQLGKLENLSNVILSLRKHALNVSVLNIDQQILVSFIARLYYNQHKNHIKMTHEIYNQLSFVAQKVLAEENFLKINHKFAIKKERFLKESITNKIFFLFHNLDFVNDYLTLLMKRKRINNSFKLK